MVQLLSVGSSEADLFPKGRDLLQEEYKLQAIVRSQPWSTLDMCLSMIQEALTPTTDIITIWALTPYAWRQTSIAGPQQSQISLFEPNRNVSIDQVPGLMTKIVQYVQRQNPNCEVYLVIPSIKDLYRFNQTRIIKKYGAVHEHFLHKHNTMNPIRMREHSCMVYQLFKDLEKEEYYWPNKLLMYGNSAINSYFSRSGAARIKVKPHVAYLRRESLSLNLSLLPDGLHGSYEFLKFFMVNHRKVFYPLIKHPETRMSESYHSPPTSFGGPSPYVLGIPQIPSATATVEVNTRVGFQQRQSDAASRTQWAEERLPSTSQAGLLKSHGLREYSPPPTPLVESSSQSMRNNSLISPFSPATYQACVRNLINSFCTSGGEDDDYKLHVIRKIKEALDNEEEII